MNLNEPAPFLTATRHQTMLRALLVHTQPLGREYVRACVEGGDLVVVAEAAAYDDALSLVRALRPDVVIAELLPDPPDQTGFQLAHRLRRDAPGTATVLLGDMGASARPHLDALARTSGAAGVLPYAALSAPTLANLLNAAATPGVRVHPHPETPRYWQ